MRVLTECTVCEGDGYLPEFDEDERDEALGVDPCPECEGLGYISPSERDAQDVSRESK